MISAVESNQPQASGAPLRQHHYLEQIGKIYFYVYASEATCAFGAEDLRDLLVKSRSNNSALGVSGMLLYKAGCFLQLLEGPKEAVDRLVERISRDPRHGNVMMLTEGFENEYQFADWSMGFQDLDSVEAKATPGYTEFLNTSFDANAFSSDPTLGQRILMTFKRVV